MHDKRIECSWVSSVWKTWSVDPARRADKSKVARAVAPGHKDDGAWNSEGVSGPPL